MKKKTTWPNGSVVKLRGPLGGLQGAPGILKRGTRQAGIDGPDVLAAPGVLRQCLAPPPPKCPPNWCCWRMSARTRAPSAMCPATQCSGRASRSWTWLAPLPPGDSQPLNGSGATGSRLRALEDWSFGHKLSALAGIAVLGLLGSAVVTATTGMRTGRLLERIETGHLPALLMAQGLGPRLRDENGVGLQNAAAAQDVDALVEVDTLRDRFLATLETQRKNEALPAESNRPADEGLLRSLRRGPGAGRTHDERPAERRPGAGNRGHEDAPDVARSLDPGPCE